MYTENQRLQSLISLTGVYELGTYLNVVISTVCISTGTDIFLCYG